MLSSWVDEYTISILYSIEVYISVPDDSFSRLMGVNCNVED